MAFQQGLSGLNVSARSLDVIGNNIANASTVGFKYTQAQFADVYATTLTGARQIGIGAMINETVQQFGQGNIASSSNPLDLAINGNGFFRMLNSSSETTYTRNGQFLLDKDGYITDAVGNNLTGYGVSATYDIVPAEPTKIKISTSDLAANATTDINLGINLDSRESHAVTLTSGTLTGSAAPTTLLIDAGNDQFTLAVDGTTSGTVTIPNATYTSASTLAAAMETAINADSTLVAANKLVDVSVNASGYLVITSRSGGTSSTVASATSVGGDTTVANALGSPTSVAGTDSFSASTPTSYNHSTSVTTYDSLGNAHTLTLFYQKTSPNTWRLYTQMDGVAPTSTAGLTADDDGLYYAPIVFNSSGALVTPSDYTVDDLAFTVNTGATTPLIFDLDMTGSSQYGTTFGVNSLSQDGYTAGKLAGLSVGKDGVIQSRYTNGQSRNAAQVVVATFSNPNGLLSLGGNQWIATSESGQPLVNEPGVGAGTLQSAAYEESNVDLTAELVAMIVQQRIYQANAQTIKTQDSVLQTLVNMR